MTTWTNDELYKIGTAEELEIAPRRQDETLLSRFGLLWTMSH